MLSTFPHNQVDFVLDWLTCTLPFLGYDVRIDQDGVVTPYPDNLDAVRFLFGEMELQERNRYRGYTHTALLECGGCIAWHASNPGQKLLIDLSGSALAELGCPALELVANLLASGVTFTRLDVARDDFGGLLDLAQIEQALRAGEVVSRFRRGRSVKGFELGGTGEDGYTVYVGSDQSAVKVRFYDKRIEQLQKGQQVDHSHWVRCEMQFRAEAAHKLAQGLAAAGSTCGPFLAGVFLNYLDFKQVGEDTNKSRWRTQAWWSAFLATSEKVRLGLGRALRTVQQAQQWIAEQVAVVWASLKVVDTSWLDGAIEFGIEALFKNRRHKLRLDRWLVEHEEGGNFVFGAF